jgi:two-component system sensor histidine kinase UhpB
MLRNVALFWRVFAVNGGLLAVLAILLIVTPVTISAPIKLEQVLIIVVGLLRRGQRLEVRREDEVGRVVRAFNQMLDRLESERQQSGRRVLAAQEAERVGIARDLHDEVGQVLTGVLLHLNSIAEAVPTHRGEIDAAKQAVRAALDEVRRISSELRPEMLEHLGLVSALTELSTTFARVSGLHVERQLDPTLPKLPPDAELAVYRIAQESLTNVARHAAATAVTITLERGHESVVLSVTDDGRGFIGGPQEHGGLRSMRERASLIDGALAVKSARGGGVEVRLEVPAPAMVQTVGAEG